MKYASFVYNLQAAPLSFDFCNFLGYCRIISKVEGFERYGVVLDARNQRALGQVEGSYSTNWSARKLDSLIDCARLCPAIELLSIVNRDALIPEEVALPRRHFFNRVPYYFKDLVDLCSKHEIGILSLRNLFEPNQEYCEMYKRRLPQRTVAFHLRNCPFNSSRNAPLNIFQDAIAKLRKRGVNCIVVGDVDSFVFGSDSVSREDLSVPFPAPSFDVKQRFNLAAAATLNVTWGGGFAHPFWLSTVPYLSFGLLNPTVSFNTMAALESKGPFPRRQFPWALPCSQQLNWTPASETSSKTIVDAVVNILEGDQETVE